MCLKWSIGVKPTTKEWGVCYALLQQATSIARIVTEDLLPSEFYRSGWTRMSRGVDEAITCLGRRRFKIESAFIRSL